MPAQYNEGDSLRKVVVCSPGTVYFEVKDLKEHNIIAAADKKRAQEQHSNLVRALSSSGADVISISELSGDPNSIFTQDAAIGLNCGFIKARMGLEQRYREPDHIAQILIGKGFPCLFEITAPATLEGGDVILAGKVAFVGHSSRTNPEGVRQISDFLCNLNYQVRTVRVPSPYLHLGGAMSVISPDTILSCSGIFPEGFFQGFKNITVPGDSFIAANVITLSERQLIVESSNNKAANVLAQCNFKVELIDLSEFIKGSGGPSCLVMPLVRG